jgi:hypothetical protein
LGIKDEDEFFKKVQEKLEYSGPKNKYNW